MQGKTYVVRMWIALVITVVLTSGWFGFGGLKERYVDHRTCPMENRTLDMIGVDAQFGHAYYHTGSGLKVFLVISRNGVLVQSGLGSEPFFVKTSHDYVDGQYLHCGYYVCIGKYTYKTPMNTKRTVWAFEAMNQGLADERIRIAKANAIKEEYERKNQEMKRAHEKRMADIELAKIRDEEERKLNEETRKRAIELETKRIQMEKGQEEARLRAEKKAEEERKKRYPIEQAERKEYASLKLKNISFELESYFVIQRDLKRYISSMSITELMWNKLAMCQKNEDWLGMLKIIASDEMKDYPDTKTIDNLVDKLKETEFHAEFIRSHEISIQGVQIDISNLSHRYGPFGGRRWKKVASQLWIDHNPMHVEFIIENGRNTIIMSGEGFDDDMENEFDNEMKQLRKDLELGRIAEGDAEKRRLEALKKYMIKVKNWLFASKVKAGKRITGVTSSAAFSQSRDGAGDTTTMDRVSSSVKNAVGEKDEKTMQCPSCNGKRYVMEEIVCEKCDGVGTITYRSSITGFDGRPLPSRTRKCGGCRGKGNVGKRVKCKECKGKGKIIP